MEAKQVDRPARVPVPHIMAWEITRSCNLSCAHGGASALYGPYEGGLTTEDCFRVINEIAEDGKPIIVLTGGEPLFRKDLFDIAKYAIDQGFRVAPSPNGTLVTEEVAQKMKRIGIPRISVSVDFPTAELHDKFRGMPGAFEGAMRGIANARKAGVE